MGTSSSPASGNRSAPRSGTGDFWLVKVDASGQKIEDRSLGEMPANVEAIAPTAGGGFIFAGYNGRGEASVGGIPTNGRENVWVMRTSDTGVILWQRLFTGGNDGGNAFSVRQTGDGGFMVGSVSAADPGADKSSPNYGSSDWWLIRLDASGNKVWDRSFGGSGAETLYDVLVLNDGGFIAAGSSDSPPSGSKSSANYGGSDAWVVRLDASGKKLWDRSYGGKLTDVFKRVQVASDGGFVFVGNSFSAASGNKTSPNHGSVDGWVVRTDANGAILWDKSFGGSGSEDLDTIQPAPGGGFLAGGFSLSTGGTGNKTAAARGLEDIWVVRLDSNGNKLWDESFGGSGVDILADIIVGNDGSIFVVGDSNSGPSGNKLSGNWSPELHDYWIIKLK